MAAKRRRGTVLVSTRPIPRFRILSDLESQAERHMNTNLKQAIREIKDLIVTAPPDPAEMALIEAAAMVRSLGIGDQRILELVGADLEAVAEIFEDLRKSAEAGSPGLFEPNDQEVDREERRSLALVAHEIRKQAGAPINPSRWLAGRGDEVVDLLLSFVPFRMGRLVPNRAGARDLPPRYRQGRVPDRFPVPMVDEFHLNVNVRSQQMRAILEGTAPAQVPEVVRHQLAEGMDPVYSVISGGETFLLALWAGLPALEMDVWQPKKSVPAAPPMLPVVDDMEALNRLMFEKFSPHQYRVPPALEPVARLARLLPRVEFLDRFAGRPSVEEIETRQAADLANATRTTIWVSIARAAQASGVSKVTAQQRAEKSPEWKRATKSWRALEWKAVRLEVEGHAGREAMRVVKAQALGLADQLDLPLSGPGVMDDFTLWLEARHGRLPEMDDLEQPATPSEYPGSMARRLPNSVSERRHPNLYEYDGAPSVFTFTPPDCEAGEVDSESGEVYVPGANQPPPEAYRYPEGEPLLVTEVETEGAEGGPAPDPEAVEPALVISTRG